MRALLRPAVLISLALAATRTYAGDAPVATAGTVGAPPPVDARVAPLSEDESPEAVGAWARGVMAKADVEGSRDAGRARCAAADAKPHGEVWGGIGTGGYREAGGVVTQPIGGCGQVTIGVSHATDGGRPWR
jgi:hypothetical protein